MTVILPIYGFATPFHISTIKNVTKTEEADNVVLRINFQSPGQIAGKKEDMVCIAVKSATTLKRHSRSKTPTQLSCDQQRSARVISVT